MRPMNVVLAHHDPVMARALAESLRPQFRKLVIVNTVANAEAEIARLRANYVIVDLELFSYADLQKLCSEFPSTLVASVHRLADEAMWLQSLAVGAIDCCQSNDLRGLLRAPERYPVAMAAAG
jgi:DNA-binding NarL/FixJ family response regulator